MSQQHPQPQPQFGMQQPPPPPGMGFGAPPPGWQGPGFPPGVPPPGMAPQPFPPHQFGPPGQQQQHYGPPGAMPPFGRPPGPMPPHMGAMPPHMMPPGFQQPPPGQQYQNFQPQQQQPPMRQQQAPQQAPPQNTPASIESERERQRRERERLVQQSTEDRQKQAMQQNEQMMMMGVVPPRPVQPPQQPARAPSPSRQDKQSRDRDRGDRDRSDRDRDRRDRDRDRGDRDRDRDRRDRDRSDRDRRDRDRDDRDNRERSDPGRDQRNDKQDKSASSSTTAQNKKPIAAPTTTNKQPTTRQQARAPPQFKFKKFENTLRNKSSFLVNMRFQSALPPVPFEPKMMAYPMDSMRFVNYYTTSLEKNYKHELFLDPFSAIPIDLVDPDTYRAQPNTTLAPEDLALLADDETTTRGKRSKVAPNVAWLRKTEYLTNEEKIMGRAVTAVGAVDKKRGQQQATAASIPAEEDTSEEGEIRRIDATFDEAREIDEKFARGELKHPTKPGIEVTEVLPVFPNFELYSNVYNIVSFDTDPIPDNIIHPVDEEKRLGKPFDQWDPAKKRSFRSRGNGELYRDAMIIPTDNDTALSYLMPKNKPFINKNTSNKKRRREAEAPLDNNGNVREYEWERDYTFRTSQLNGTYFFVIDPESNTVKYLNIETKFDLAKKKAKQGRERDDDEDAEDAEHHASQQESLPPSRVLVQWRDFNEEEKEHIQAAMADFGDAAVDAAAPPARRNGTSSSRSRNTSTSSRVVSRR